MATQLPLNIELNDSHSFENYYSGPNQQIVEYFQQLFVEDGGQLVYIWGGEGAGKSHLVQALCRYFSVSGKAAFYLPLKNKQDFSEAVFENLENMSLVVIDDIDQIIGDAVWEEALFHFYNRVKDNQGCHLIISGDAAPDELGVSLADLASRLLWGMVFHIKVLNDQDKLKALQQRAHCRGLALSDEVARYLLNNCPRDLPYLFGLLDKLDQASLVAQQKLTIPFIKTLL